MTIHSTLLGRPFEDNALYLVVDSGTQQTRLLFDCGENTLNHLSIGEIQKIDHVFFSHFHLDHIAGFDRFIRVNYNREASPVHIWGPYDTIDVIFNRMNSFTWNLLGKTQTQWFIHEVSHQSIKTVRLFSHEFFAQKHFVEEKEWRGSILTGDTFTVQAHFLNHRIFTLGYMVRESERKNIDKKKLKEAGLPAGPWLNEVKNTALPDETEITVGTKKARLGELRAALLKTTPGDCVSYLTDFSYGARELSALSEWLKGCHHLYCESQYLEDDHLLAQQNYHLTTKEAALLAQKAEVQKLTLFHFSRRYKHLGIVPFVKEAGKYFRPVVEPDVWLSRE